MSTAGSRHRKSTERKSYITFNIVLRSTYTHAHARIYPSSSDSLDFQELFLINTPCSPQIVVPKRTFLRAGVQVYIQSCNDANTGHRLRVSKDKILANFSCSVTTFMELNDTQRHQLGYVCE
jgi:hypothetical protein